MSAQSANRIAWVDAAKGLSIMLVVMMHSTLGVGEATGQVGFMHYVVAFTMPFRMPEFFLISGLFLSAVIAREWKLYADRRIVHYLYFYALWAVITLVFKGGLLTGDIAGFGRSLVTAIVEPYSVLWFIYDLALFGLAAKLLHTLRAPHWLVLIGAAALQIAPVHTPSYALDQFAEYFVYFYAGYALAPLAFRVVEEVIARPLLGLAGFLAWAVINGFAVFSPGFLMELSHIEAGFADLPGIHLAFALTGALAVCVAAGLLSTLPFMKWLSWLGARSIVVYLAFVIPMAATRLVLIKLGFITDAGVLSLLVMIAAIVAPLILNAAIEWTGWGKFLFTRPRWAHLPGALAQHEARRAARRAAVQPAE